MDLRNQTAASDIGEQLDREFPAGGAVAVEDGALHGNSSPTRAVPPPGNGAAVADETAPVGKRLSLW